MAGYTETYLTKIDIEDNLVSEEDYKFMDVECSYVKDFFILNEYLDKSVNIVSELFENEEFISMNECRDTTVDIDELRLYVLYRVSQNLTDCELFRLGDKNNTYDICLSKEPLGRTIPINLSGKTNYILFLKDLFVEAIVEYLEEIKNVYADMLFNYEYSIKDMAIASEMIYDYLDYLSFVENNNEVTNYYFYKVDTIIRRLEHLTYEVYSVEEEYISVEDFYGDIMDEW